jgi:hypothetical protein
MQRWASSRCRRRSRPPTLAGCRSATTPPTALRRCCGAHSAVALPQADRAQHHDGFHVWTLSRAAPLHTHRVQDGLTPLLLLVRRQQLERSESLRVAGQRALAELKAEFEALTGELVAEGQLSGGDAAAAVAHAASVAADQQQRGSSGSLRQHAGEQGAVPLGQ